ncbi:uncharacterized protein VTP21DRAFT_6550 [Calcarisporiella thermophila]|uniref:uncharacterized protein n=1 Tax=Calcarisporiella thermophila TaxID=911321 RepID=UPI003742B569
MNLLRTAVLLAVAMLPAVQATALWPKPQKVTRGSTTLSLDRGIQFDIAGDNALVTEAAKRYKDLIMKAKFTNHVPDIWAPNGAAAANETDKATKGSLSTVAIKVENAAEDLGIETDESYTLDITAEGQATINAKTQYGAIRALETFSQLVNYAGDSDAFTIPGAPWKIEDAPVFKWRGLLLDTSRNYFPVESIQRILDGMSYNKMNVFHWHIVDAPSFPYVSAKYPELAAKGAYGPNMVYTADDIKTIVNYAKARGIRVMPEFDVPGHSYAVTLSHPEWTACPNALPDWSNNAAEPPSGQLHPGNEQVRQMVKDIFAEFAELFPDQYVHGGGDEVQKGCWENDPNVKQYMTTKQLTIDGLLKEFFNDTHSFLRSKGRVPVSWDDMILKHEIDLGKDVVVQIWNEPENIKNATSRGYKIIDSTYRYYYFDCGRGPWVGNFTYGKSWCSPYKHWQHIYDHNPRVNLTEEEAKLVLGGEVAMWTEQADQYNVDTLLWPRASAAAEVWWSGHGKDPIDALYRLNDQRFRLVSRGVPAESLQPLWCVRNPGACNLDPPQWKWNVPS